MLFICEKSEYKTETIISRIYLVKYSCGMQFKD